MSVLCMENLHLGKNINECLVHGCTMHLFMSCPKGKFSMHKAFIYVLSSVQVLHAQDIRLCSVGAFCMENLTIGQDINECLVHEELYLRTEHK
jgi:hypothetical protein